MGGVGRSDCWDGASGEGKDVGGCAFVGGGSDGDEDEEGSKRSDTGDATEDEMPSTSGGDIVGGICADDGWEDAGLQYLLLVLSGRGAGSFVGRPIPSVDLRFPWRLRRDESEVIGTTVCKGIARGGVAKSVAAWGGCPPEASCRFAAWSCDHISSINVRPCSFTQHWRFDR